MYIHIYIHAWVVHVSGIGQLQANPPVAYPRLPQEAHTKDGNYDGVNRFGRRRIPLAGTELPSV